VGAADWAAIRDRLDHSNPYVMRFYEYLNASTTSPRDEPDSD
jgi:hypothetical protein